LDVYKVAVFRGNLVSPKQVILHTRLDTSCHISLQVKHVVVWLAHIILENVIIDQELRLYVAVTVGSLKQVEGVALEDGVGQAKHTLGGGDTIGIDCKVIVVVDCDSLHQTIVVDELGVANIDTVASIHEDATIHGDIDTSTADG